MPMVAAHAVRDRSILVASAACVVFALLLLGLTPSATPITMLVAAKSALMIGLLGLRRAAGLADSAEREDDDGD